MQLASESRITVLSDLHFGHPASLITDLRMIEPLIADQKVIVFNGDTVEMRSLEQRESGRLHLDQIARLCSSVQCNSYFVNGNHDPFVSSASHIDVANGAALITHGDILWMGIAPWSRDSEAISVALKKELVEMGDGSFTDFEKRLFAVKRAALVEVKTSEMKKGLLARMLLLAQQLWPPWRPALILKSWIETPFRAVALARVFRPRARFLILGHTHFAGIWKLAPRTVINTGSYLPPFGARAVFMEGDQLWVRLIDRGGGAFRYGREVFRAPLGPLSPEDGF